MEDSKRLVLAFVIVMLILFFWQTFFSPKKPVPQPEAKKVTEPESSVKLEARESKREEADTEKVREGREFILESDKLKIVLSSYGGTVKSVYLKEYSCELLSDFPHFSSQVLMDGIVKRVDTLFWNFDTSTVGIGRGKEISMWTEDSGILFLRRYWMKDDWTISSSLEFTAPPHSAAKVSQFIISLNRGLTFTERDTNDDYANFRILRKVKDKIWEKGIKRFKPEMVKDWSWIGFATKYFLMVIKGEGDSLLLFPTPDRKAGAKIFVSPKEDKVPIFSIAFYPLKYQLLAAKKEGLEKAVPLGWPKFLSIAILHILLFLYSGIKNYGLVIIIFSLLMKGILFPLTRFQLQQMKKLQLLAPKLEELRRKYKNDPKTLNQETMRLYSVHRMNPLSGCLPLLAQIPIFWALYSVLRSTVELRRADFIFWIKDLSLRDPYYVLPILMGLSFLLQNIFTSFERRNIFLTIFFPIFLTVIFLNFPSGLQLYWFTFNILSLVESLVVYKRR